MCTFVKIYIKFSTSDEFKLMLFFTSISAHKCSYAFICHLNQNLFAAHITSYYTKSQKYFRQKINSCDFPYNLYIKKSIAIQFYNNRLMYNTYFLCVPYAYSSSLEELFNNYKILCQIMKFQNETLKFCHFFFNQLRDHSIRKKIVAYNTLICIVKKFYSILFIVNVLISKRKFLSAKLFQLQMQYVIINKLQINLMTHKEKHN